MIPPAILNAGSVMRRALKIRLPATANVLSAMPQVQAERRAMSLRTDDEEFTVMARNIGITAKGSTRKKTDVTASSANSRTCVTECNMDDSCATELPT